MGEGRGERGMEAQEEEGGNQNPGYGPGAPCYLKRIEIESSNFGMQPDVTSSRALYKNLASNTNHNYY